MLASVHVADVGVKRAIAVVRKPPKPDAVPGLRNAEVALAAPLGRGRMPRPDPRRLGLIALWDDDAALDEFLATNPIAAVFAHGWRVRLQPLRAHGAWPGLDADLPKPRSITSDGPTAVLTLGRMRWKRAIPFFRASMKAERAVRDAPGLIWASGFRRPPFVATCSLWETPEATVAYAYGAQGAPHPRAIAQGNAKPFHHRQAFIRFRPYASEGELEGSNSLLGNWLHLAKS